MLIYLLYLKFVITNFSDWKNENYETSQFAISLFSLTLSVAKKAENLMGETMDGILTLTWEQSEQDVTNYTLFSCMGEYISIDKCQVGSEHAS